MHQHDVARTLGRIASLLELKGEHAPRVRAFQAAAKALQGFTPPAHPDAAALGAVPGLDASTRPVAAELLATGESALLMRLEDDVPPGLVEMLAIPGLGVQRVRQVYRELGVDTLDELEEAALDGRLGTLPRMGPRTIENVLRGLRQLRSSADQRLLHHARAEAHTLARALADLKGVTRVEPAGSTRRGRELVRDLDFVVELDGRIEDLYERLGRSPGVSEFVHRRERAVTLRFTTGTVADVFPATPRDFGFVLLRATGAAAHVDRLAARAAARGLRWTDEGLVRDGAPLPAPDEAAVYAALELPFIPPELREDGGELDAADAGTLPDLVTGADLTGFLHCHTNYSDGTSTVAAWAEAAAGRFAYVGVTDHSQAAPYAGGLGVEDIARQHAEIDAVNARQSDVRILKGVEADILEDGTLDYPPRVRERFDFIIASVHARHGMDERGMTGRILRAMDDPTMTILGHPTGRLLLSRDPFPMDFDQVFARAAERGIAVEINADPQRLDLDWRQVRRATDMGVTISIGADAHGTGGIDNVDLGVLIARKGWLERGQLLNARALDDFLAFARARRGEG